VNNLASWLISQGITAVRKKTGRSLSRQAGADLQRGSHVILGLAGIETLNEDGRAITTTAAATAASARRVIPWRSHLHLVGVRSG
jgi:hypothetical protein